MNIKKTKSIKIVLLVFGLLLANIVAILVYYYPGLYENPDIYNEKVMLKYIYRFYYKYHLNEGKYPETKYVLYKYIPFKIGTLDNINIEILGNEIIIYGEHGYFKHVGNLLDYNEYPQTLKFIMDKMMQLDIILLLDIIIILLLIFELITLLRKIKITMVFIIIFILITIGLKNIDNRFKGNVNCSLKDIYTEIYLLKQYYEKVKNKHENDNTISEIPISYYTKKDFIKVKNENNEVIESPSPEYYAKDLSLAKQFGYAHVILYSVKLFLYDSYTDTHFFQYDYFKKYKYKVQIYKAILLSSLCNVIITMCCIMIIVFILNIYWKENKSNNKITTLQGCG